MTKPSPALQAALAAWQPALEDAMEAALREVYEAGSGSDVTVVAVNAYVDEDYLDQELEEDEEPEPVSWLDLAFLTFRRWGKMTAGGDEDPDGDITWDPENWELSMEDLGLGDALADAVRELCPSLGTPEQLRDALAEAAVTALTTPRIRGVLEDLAGAQGTGVPVLLATRDGSDPGYTAATFDRLNAGNPGGVPHLTAEGRAYWQRRAAAEE